MLARLRTLGRDDALPNGFVNGSRFDITTGAAINGPATAALKIYDVQEAHGSILIHA